ncbi:MAG TPA: hypothetical protein VFS05_09475 [Gemmatimonadaceae bacterium]|nr:hypothetical protein [Gemmatimonadaceae bacterium]
MMKPIPPMLAALALATLLAAAAPRAAASQDTTATPSAAPAAPTAQPPAWVIAPPGARLAGAEEGGRYITLADGSWWEVRPDDRPAADIWAAPQYIVVRQNPAPVRTAATAYDWLLTNGAERRTVIARFIGFEKPTWEYGGEGK